VVLTGIRIHAATAKGRTERGVVDCDQRPQATVRHRGQIAVLDGRRSRDG